MTILRHITRAYDGMEQHFLGASVLALAALASLLAIAG